MNRLPVYRIILIACFYLSLVRGTSIGLFYPSDELLIGGIDYTFIKYTNYALLLGLVGYLFTANNYSLFTDNALRPPILIFISICLISIIFSVDQVQSVKFLIALIALSCPCIIYIYEYGADRFLTESSRFIIILAILSFIYVLIMPQYGVMSGKHAGAWRGLFEHKNGAGPFFALGFYFLLNRLQKTQKEQAIPLLIGMVLCFVFVIMSKSSTAIIAFILAGILYTAMQVIYRFKNAGERLGLFIAGGSLLLLIGFFSMEYINDIIYSVTGKDATLSGRTAIWAPLIDMSFARPLHGYGLGMVQRPEFIEQIHKYITFEAQSTHNSYLDLVLNIGYPGTILFLLLSLKVFFVHLLQNINTRNVLRNQSLFMSLLLTLFVISFTSSYVLLGRSFFWIWLLSALICLTQSATSQDAQVKDIKTD